MQTLDWWLLVHPVLAVVLIYPLLGIVVRLGWQARQRRVHKAKLPAITGRDHSQLGQWLASAVVVLVLIALAVVISSKQTANTSRQLPLLLAWLGTATSLLALWRVQSAGLRLSFGLITWSGVLALGAQPEVFRLSDNPWRPPSGNPTTGGECWCAGSCCSTWRPGRKSSGICPGDACTWAPMCWQLFCS